MSAPDVLEEGVRSKRGPHGYLGPEWALKAWAHSGPARLELDAYDAWATQQNRVRGSNRRIYPTAARILAQVGQEWPRLLRRPVRSEPGRPQRPTLDAVREWLASEPLKETRSGYLQWARTERQAGRYQPSPDALQRALRMTWTEVLLAAVDLPFGDGPRPVRVAPYEPKLIDAGPRATRLRVSPELELLSDKAVVQRLSRLSTRRPIHNGSLGLVAVFSVHKIDYFYGGDVDALEADRPFPRRTPSQLADELMTGAQVAAALGYSESTIRNYVARGSWRLLPPPVLETKGVRSVLWRRSDITAFLGREVVPPARGEGEQPPGVAWVAA